MQCKSNNQFLFRATSVTSLPRDLETFNEASVHYDTEEIEELQYTEEIEELQSDLQNSEDLCLISSRRKK